MNGPHLSLGLISWSQRRGLVHQVEAHSSLIAYNKRTNKVFFQVLAKPPKFLLSFKKAVLILRNLLSLDEAPYEREFQKTRRLFHDFSSGNFIGKLKHSISLLSFYLSSYKRRYSVDSRLIVLEKFCLQFDHKEM